MTKRRLKDQHGLRDGGWGGGGVAGKDLNDGTQTATASGPAKSGDRPLLAECGPARVASPANAWPKARRRDEGSRELREGAHACSPMEEVAASSS